MTTPADPYAVWVVTLLAGGFAFGLRLSFIELFSHRELPAWSRRALRFVAPAVLFAIVAPAVLLGPDGRVGAFASPRVAAALFAVLVTLRWRSPTLAIFGGMAVLWSLQALQRL